MDKGEYLLLRLKRAYERILDFCKFGLIAKMDMQQEKKWRYYGCHSTTVVTTRQMESDFIGKRIHSRKLIKKWILRPWRIYNQLVWLNERTQNFRPEQFRQSNAMASYLVYRSNVRMNKQFYWFGEGWNSPMMLSQGLWVLCVSFGGSGLNETYSRAGLCRNWVFWVLARYNHP